MINTKDELKYYLAEDKKRYGQRKLFILGFLFGDETFGTQIFLRRLRKTEFYYNTLNKRNPISLLRFVYSFFIYRQLWNHYCLHIPLNVCGPGLYIPHRMGGGIYECY